MRTAIVLQARFGSTRLPGKVLAPIGNRTLIEHCIVRLAASGLPVIVATTTGAEDDAVADVATRAGADVFRGPEDDVLLRYVGAAERAGAAEIIRATADNPFVDAEAPLRTLVHRRRVDADHVIECGLPVGAAVEAVTADALARAHAVATDPYDREHVTSLIRRDIRFRALRALAPGHLREPRLRLTVDTADDLARAREIWMAVNAGGRVVTLAEIIRAAGIPRPVRASKERGA